MKGRGKVYIGINANFNNKRKCRTKSIIFRNGRVYETLQSSHVASAKVGGTGIRYTKIIFGHEPFMFNERNGRWFVETKL